MEGSGVELDVVAGSCFRQAQGLFIATARDEEAGQGFSHKPRSRSFPLLW